MFKFTTNHLTQVFINIFNYWNFHKHERMQEQILQEWLNKDGDHTLRLEYDHLTSNSIVLDLGGYKGDWTNNIFQKYSPIVYIFEPVQSFYNELKTRFNTNKIKVYPFGLAETTKTAIISISQDASSILKNYPQSKKEIVQLIKATDFFEANKIDTIDLIKINIEGSEYDLLDHLIESKFITNIKNIQVQFHDFFPDASQRMQSIQNALQKTHHLTYQYKFVWENWELTNK